MSIRSQQLIAKGRRHAASGKIDQARKAFRQALKIEPQDPVGLDQLARLELRGNNPDGAIAPLRRLASVFPDEPDYRLRVASAIEESGDLIAAREELEALTQDFPENAAAYNNLGNVLQSERRFDAALDVYEKAVALQPELPGIWVNVGNMLEELERPGEAAARYSTALEIDENYRDAHYYGGRARLTLGDPGTALSDMDRCLAIDPADQEALALKATLMAVLGRRSEEKALFDYDGFLRVFQPEPPVGYATIEAFNADLAKHIQRRTKLAYDPDGASTRGGWHSGDLLNDGHDVTDALRSLLQGVFETYVSELPRDTDHPFLNRGMGRSRLVAQAQVLESQGYLASHLHPRGWISSAYYVSVPETIAQSDDDSGFLEFGVPTSDIKTDVELETRRVKPQPGTAVLFPSYFFHGTRRFQSDTPRISLGIDMLVG